ncbi:PCFT-like protein [Mya arenaria]|uniref:PCFT-like protein n=1 Tax=Mya arenaria TaxID=6604 RepID=A0ABY7FSS8_MYAAR|nr:PCFT-like protein [Mya arenaria]
MVSDESSPLLKNSTVQDELPPTKVATTNVRKVHFALLPVLLLLYMSLGLGYYTVQEWIQKYIKLQLGYQDNSNSTSGCNADKNSSTFKDFQTVEKETSKWSLYTAIALTIPSFFASMMIPAYSDSLGRKFLFVVGACSATLRMTLSALCIYYEWNLIWIVVAIVLDGLTGSLFTVSSAAMAYLADLTGHGSRSFAITAHDSILLICLTLSGLGSGFYIENKGYVYPMVTSAGMALIALLIILFVLPETHLKQNRIESKSVWATFSRMTDIYLKNDFQKQRSTYLLLIMSYFFLELVSVHRPSLEILYQLGRPFCWSPSKIGMFSAARNATQGFAGIVLIAPLKRCFSDNSIALMSIVFCTGSFVLEGLAQTDLQLYLVPVLATFSFLSIPLVKTILSTMTPAEKQGSVFASVVTVQSLCAVTADFLFNTFYSDTVNLMAGSVFLLMAALSMLPFFVLLIVRVRKAGNPDRNVFEKNVQKNPLFHKNLQVSDHIAPKGTEWVSSEKPHNRNHKPDGDLLA